MERRISREVYRALEALGGEGGREVEGGGGVKLDVPEVVLSEDVDDVVWRAVMKGNGRENLITRMREMKLEFDERQIREYEYFKGRGMGKQTFVSLLTFLEGKPEGVREALERLRTRVREAEEIVSGGGKAEQYVRVYDCFGETWYVLLHSEVVRLFWEAAGKAGGLEKLAEQLKRMRRGALVYAYLIDEWFRSREFPLEVFFDVLKYVEGTTENAWRRLKEIVGETHSRILGSYILEMGMLTPFRLAEDPLTVNVEGVAEQIYNSDGRLRLLFSLEDFRYVVGLVVGGLLRGLPQPRGEDEKAKIGRAVDEAVKYFEGLLGVAVGKLLDQSIGKLSDEEARIITDAAMNLKKQQREPDAKIPKWGEDGYLTQLAKLIKIKTRPLQSYVDVPYDYRKGMSRGRYLEICDVLNLPETIRGSKRATREDLLYAILSAIKETEDKQETKDSVIRKDMEGVLLEWFEQPPGTYCIFLKEDLRRVWEKVEKRWNNAEVTRRLKEMGVKNATSFKVEGIMRNMRLDVELVLGLIGVIVGRTPGEVRDLIRRGELAQVFKSSLEEQGLVDEEDSEWLRNLPREVVRELSLKHLLEVGGVATQEGAVAPGTAQELLKKLAENPTAKEFRIKLPQKVRRELRESIKKMKEEEGIPASEKLNKEGRGELTRKESVEKKGATVPTILDIEKGLGEPESPTQTRLIQDENGGEIKPKKEEELLTYAVRKIKERLNEEISPYTIKGAVWSHGYHRVGVGEYLMLCVVFGVKPDPSLHSRENRQHKHLSGVRSLRSPAFDVDFPIPVVYRHPGGGAVEVCESEGGFF
ncbi:MAG: hypothetical protein QXR19_16535, partial [Candidatus Jordarchaeaceae archaeon]